MAENIPTDKYHKSEIHTHLESGFSFVPAVVGIVRTENKLLMGLRKEVSNDLGVGLVSNYGGKRGDSEEIAEETDSEAFDRELYEEALLTVKKKRDMGRVRFIFPHRPTWSQDVRIFLVEEWEGEPQETDSMRPMWFDIENFPSSLSPYEYWEDNPYWMSAIMNGVPVNAVFLYGPDGNIKEYVFLDAPTDN